MSKSAIHFRPAYRTNMSNSMVPFMDKVVQFLFLQIVACVVAGNPGACGSGQGDTCSGIDDVSDTVDDEVSLLAFSSDIISGKVAQVPQSSYATSGSKIIQEEQPLSPFDEEETPAPIEELNNMTSLRVKPPIRRTVKHVKRLNRSQRKAAQAKANSPTAGHSETDHTDMVFDDLPAEDIQLESLQGLTHPNHNDDEPNQEHMANTSVDARDLDHGVDSYDDHNLKVSLISAAVNGSRGKFNSSAVKEANASSVDDDTQLLPLIMGALPLDSIASRELNHSRVKHHHSSQNRKINNSRGKRDHLSESTTPAQEKDLAAQEKDLAELTRDVAITTPSGEWKNHRLVVRKIDVPIPYPEEEQELDRNASDLFDLAP